MSIPRLTDLPHDPLFNCMVFLNYRDLAIFSCCNRAFNALCRTEESALNPLSRTAAGLYLRRRFHRIYNRNFNAPLGWSERRLTLQTLLGDNHLIVVRYPSQAIRLTRHPLNVTNLSTNTTRTFNLNRCVESFNIATRPEPTLILGNHEQGIKALTLKKLLESESAELTFEQLAPVLSCDMESNKFPVVATHEDLVVVGNEGGVEIRGLGDNSTNLFFPFLRAKQIVIQSPYVMCLSTHECAIFSLEENEKGEKVSCKEVSLYCPEIRRAKFAFAQFQSLSRISIAYMREMHSDRGTSVGVVYDMVTGDSMHLYSNSGLPGQRALNCMTGEGNSLFGSSLTFSEWNISRRGWEERAPTCDERTSASVLRGSFQDPIHTMFKIADYIVSSTCRTMLVHPLGSFGCALKIGNKLLDLEEEIQREVPPFFLNRSISHFQIQGQYLIVELAQRDENLDQLVYSVRVFDLLAEPNTERPTRVYAERKEDT